MADQVGKLEEAGVLSSRAVTNLSDTQRTALNGLSDAEVQSLTDIRGRLGPIFRPDASAADDTSGGTYF